MNQGRSDFATLYLKGNIFVFGGQSFSTSPNKPQQSLESLNSAEVYSIQKDQWTEMPNFSTARQGHSACIFNDKFIFIFGGKSLQSTVVLD